MRTLRSSFSRSYSGGFEDNGWLEAYWEALAVRRALLIPWPG
jgi:hypothetical protein